jgi:hypothetical protein
VTFEPMRTAVVDGTSATKVTFARAATYTLRAYADDGVYVTPADVVVTVNDRNSR